MNLIIDPQSPDTSDPRQADACMRAHLQAKATPEHRKARAEYVREDLPGTVDEQLAYRLRMIHAMSKIEKQYEVAELTELLPT